MRSNVWLFTLEQRRSFGLGGVVVLFTLTASWGIIDLMHKNKTSGLAAIEIEVLLHVAFCRLALHSGKTIPSTCIRIILK